MTAKLIVIGTRKPGTDDEFAKYQAGVGPLFGQAGAQPSAIYMKTGEIAGSSPQMVSIVDFPSEDAVYELFNSEAYKAIEPHRDAAYDSLDIIVAKAG